MVGAELERLSALVDKGRLTLDEFNEQKARLLGRPVSLVPPPKVDEPNSDALALAALERSLTTPERCVRQLRAYGCYVTESPSGVWEVSKTEGGVKYHASTFQVLQRMTLEHARERAGSPAW